MEKANTFCEKLDCPLSVKQTEMGKFLRSPEISCRVVITNALFPDFAKNIVGAALQYSFN